MIREQVAIAVPSTDNQVSLTLLSFYAALKDSEADPRWRWITRLLPVDGLRNVPYARNKLIGDFLRTDCDWLWFIDADMMPAESSARLLHNEADISCGRMFKWDHERPEVQAGLTVCAYDLKDGRFHPCGLSPNESALKDVDGIGTGSMKIRRRVLEDHRMWLDGAYASSITGQDYNLYDEIGPEFAPPIFQERFKPNGNRTLGSDLEFCYRAKALGYSVQVDMAAHVGHRKWVNLDEVALTQERFFRLGVDYGTRAAR